MATTVRSRVKDITGKRFGKLVANKHVGFSSGHKNAIWRFKCDCGGFKECTPTTAKTADHCGCLTKDRLSSRSKTHGCATVGFRTRTYKIWDAMIQRCTNPNHKAYPDYGGRGITVCDRWLNSFEAFLSDMGECPPNLTIDREDNNGCYCKDNCHWRTRKFQMNNRRCNVRITSGGLTLTLMQWSERTGIPYSTLQSRRHRGLSDDEIVRV